MDFLPEPYEASLIGIKLEKEFTTTLHFSDLPVVNVGFSIFYQELYLLFFLKRNFERKFQARFHKR